MTTLGKRKGEGDDDDQEAKRFKPDASSSSASSSASSSSSSSSSISKPLPPVLQLSSSVSLTESPARVRRRSYIKLPFFPIESSAKLKAFYAYLSSLRATEDDGKDGKSTDPEHMLQRAPPQAMCVAFSKYIRFAYPDRTNADEIDWLEVSNARSRARVVHAYDRSFDRRCGIQTQFNACWKR